MPDNIITRQHANLISPNTGLPDPLHALSAYERLRLLTTPPTWSERWRLCDPKLSKEQRRDLLIDILFERRQAYDHLLHHRAETLRRQRIEHFYRTNQPMPLPADALSSTAMKDLRQQRYLADQREQHIREAYFQRRADRESENHEPAYKPSRRHGR